MEYSAMQIAVESWFTFVCLFITIITAGMMKDKMKKSTRAMLGLFFVILLTMASDVCCMAFNGIPTDTAFIATNVANILNYLNNALALSVVFIYLSLVVRENGGKIAPIWSVLIYGCTLILIAFIIVSHFTGIVYSIDAQNIYTRGPLFWLDQAVGIVGMAIFVFCIASYKKYLSRIKMWAFVFYIIFPIMAIMIQLLVAGPLLTMSFGFTIVVMFIETIIQKVREEEEALEAEEQVTPSEETEESEIQLDARIRNCRHIFIVNPEAGGDKDALELRKTLSKIKGLDYFIFNTRGRFREQELVQKVLTYFAGEKLRIYCCGGSGTFRNVLDGIPQEMLPKIEIAFYPMGLSNDFLKSFDEQEVYFKEIESIITGKTVKVDYIRGNHGVAINTFSVGLDANINSDVDKYKHLSMFGEMFPYFYSIFRGLFVTSPVEYDLWVDDNPCGGKLAEIIFGNGKCIGGMLYFSDKANVNQGEANMVIVGDRKSFGLLGLMIALTQKNMPAVDKYASRSKAKKIKLKQKDNTPFYMNFDGEMVGPYEEWEAELIPRGLNLIMPKEVICNE